MQASLFIVWRESVEALLVIGILYAWIRQNNIIGGKTAILGGTIGGLILASLLAVAFWFAGNWYAGAGGDWFFAAMMIIAAFLILHMVVWMNHHGRSMKSSLDAQAQTSMAQNGLWGIAILAMLAIAREGSETVVFLYGVGIQADNLAPFVYGALAGLALGLLSFAVLQYFSNAISWKWFFRISQAMLLLIGGAMLVGGVDKITMQLSGYDLPEWAYSLMDTPLWDTSWILADSSALTGLTGYHAAPSMAQIGALVFYWLLAIILCNRRRAPKPPASIRAQSHNPA